MLLLGPFSLKMAILFLEVPIEFATVPILRLSRRLNLDKAVNNFYVFLFLVNAKVLYNLKYLYNLIKPRLTERFQLIFSSF